MNRMFKLALSLVFTAALVVPAMAQDMYPDVPENHWAYDAIARLRKDNILVPGLVPGQDNKYLGRCNLTRYEFAVYIDRLYRVITSRFADLQSQIDALKEKVGDGKGPGVDLSGMQAQIDALKAQISGMQGWGDDIKSLQRLVNEFQKELNGLDLNVTEMKKQLADLDSRVSALEARKPNFDITGKADLAILAGHSTDDNYGLMHDGTVTGYNRHSGGGGQVGLSKDVTVLHNLALTLQTTATEGPKVKGTLVVGNVLGTLGPYSMSRDMRTSLNAGAGMPFDETNFDDSNTDIYFQELNATWNASLVGQGVSAKLGRFGWQAGKYLFQRPAYTSQYYSDEARDSGDYYMDGVALGFGFGRGSGTILFARNSNLRGTNSAGWGANADFSQIIVGANASNPGPDPGVPTVATVDTTTGVALNFPIGEVGKINLAYLLHDMWGSVNDSSNQNGLAPGTLFGAAGATANRIQTWGADATFRFNNIDFGAAYAKGTFFDNNSSRLDSDNAAWDVNARFNVSNVKIGAGYRRVEKNFAAVANTGRFGTYFNPRNFEGWNVNASFNPTPDVEIYGSGEFVKGVGAPGYFATPLMSTGDKIDTFTVGVNFKANVFDVGLSYEDVKFRVGGSPDAKQRWYTLGLGYSMSANSRLSLKYIFSDVDNGAGSALGSFLSPNMSPGYGTPGVPGGNGVFKGGLLATQLSVKF